MEVSTSLILITGECQTEHALEYYSTNEIGMD